MRMGRREGSLGMRERELKNQDWDMWFLFGALHAEMVGLASLCSNLHLQSKHLTDY